MLLLSSRSMFGGLLALIALCGCGGVSRIDPAGLGGETAGSASGGAGSAGGSGEEPAGGSSAAGANAAGASAGGPSACLRFRDEAPQPVTVRLRNDTLAALYLGSWMPTCGSPPLYDVLDASNVALYRRGSCGNPCQGWVDGNPVGGCPGICLYPEVTKLAAGETITTQWSGLYELQTQLPSECNASKLSGDSSVTCGVERRIQRGTYGFRAVAGSDFNCVATPTGCGACVPAATGGCTMSGAIVTGTEKIAQLTFDVSHAIEGSTDEPIQTIDLVFYSPLR